MFHNLAVSLAPGKRENKPEHYEPVDCTKKCQKQVAPSFSIIRYANGLRIISSSNTSNGHRVGVRIMGIFSISALLYPSTVSLYRMENKQR